jgi:hypothetical protein
MSLTPAQKITLKAWLQALGNADATSAIDISALTGSGGFIHAGPCYVGMTIANLSGSITISADKITS